MLCSANTGPTRDADAIVDLRGDTDVGHGELADDRARGESEESGLGQGEREGRVGTDAWLMGIPGPGVETRREIDGKDWRGMDIGRGDETRGRTRGAAAESKTEKRVHDQVGGREIVGLFSARFRRRVDRQTKGLQRSQLMGGGASQVACVMAEPDCGMGTRAMQEAGGHHAVATVATASSQHEHRFPPGIAPEEALASPGGDSLTGHLHQLQHLDAEVVDHDAIDL